MRLAFQSADPSGLIWSASGLSLSGVPFLLKTNAGFVVRPESQIVALYEATSQRVCPQLALNLEVVAAALNRGELARAMNVALSMQIRALDDEDVEPFVAKALKLDENQGADAIDLQPFFDAKYAEFDVAALSERLIEFGDWLGRNGEILPRSEREHARAEYDYLESGISVFLDFPCKPPESQQYLKSAAVALFRGAIDGGIVQPGEMTECMMHVVSDVSPSEDTGAHKRLPKKREDVGADDRETRFEEKYDDLGPEDFSRRVFEFGDWLGSDGNELAPVEHEHARAEYCYLQIALSVWLSHYYKPTKSQHYLTSAGVALFRGAIKGGVVAPGEMPAWMIGVPARDSYFYDMSLGRRAFCELAAEEIPPLTPALRAQQTTNAKTVDNLTLRYIKNPRRLFSRLKSYVDEVANHDPFRLQDRGLMRLKPFQLAIRGYASPEQDLQFYAAIIYGKQHGVRVVCSSVAE